MAGEGWEYWRHVQFALSLKDLLLQLSLSVNPALRERPLPAVYVYHALPRQMGRSCEIGADLLVGQAVLAPHLLPDGFLPVMASGIFTPFKAIQSMKRSHCGHFHQGIV